MLVSKFQKALLICIIAIFSGLTTQTQAQCNTNTSICTPGTAGPFNFVTPGPAVSSCLDWIGPNIGYIILHITSSGPLNMLINGNATSGFLDVAVFNIPNGQSPCTAIQNLSNQIGCNYASASSGCNQFGTAFPCTSSVTAPNVTAGQEIMIIVENWSGTSSTFTMQLGPPPGAQTGPPNPAITPVGPFCVTSGTTQLIAADMGGTWSGPGVSSTGVFNPATAGVGTHTINYSVGVAPCNASSSTTITVNSATVTPPGPQTICSGGSATLTASGAGSYSWSPSTGLSATTGATVTASPTTTTTYTVTGTTAGCTSTGTVTVTVAPMSVTVSPSTSICSGGSATLTANGATSYTWTPSTGLSTTSGATVTASPTTTTTYTVTGTTGSCSASATVTVTVTPVTVSVTPSTTICTGGSTTLTANGATSYTWTPTTGLSASTGATVTANPTTTTTYTVTGTTGSCSNTTTTTVTVTPLNLSVSPNVSICPGDVTTLTASGATTYTWSPSTGLSSTSGASVTANPSTTTTYTVTGTNGSCSNTANVTVTVTPVTVTVTPSTAICEGSSTTLTANGATNYTWTPATGLSSSTGSTVTANPTTTTTYTVTGTSGSCSNSATTTVTVNPIPTVTASNNGPLCDGATLNLTSSSLAGATYSWSGPNGFSSSQQNPTMSATISNNGVYTVSTSLNGCTSSATTTVVVNSSQIPVITPAGPFCVNASNTNLVSSIPGGTWSGTGITDVSNGTFSPATVGAGTYTINYVVAGGCSSPATTTIVVNPLPVIAVTPTVISGCVPVTTSFIDNTVPASASISWNFGDGSANSTQLGNVSHTYSSAGCYTLTVSSTSSAGCTASAQFPNIVCGLPNAVAAFNVDNPIHGLMNPVFQTINGSANATSYSWDFGDGQTSTATAPQVTYTEDPANYTIMLIANNPGNCPDTAYLTVVIEEELIFYVPNAFTPDGDEFNNSFLPIFTSGFDPYSYSLSIYNRWGEILFESKDHKVGWDGTYDDKLCPVGTYTWTISFKDSKSDKKITKTGHVEIIK